MIASIVAYDHNHTIGNHGEIPWQGQMKSDSRYFRDMTLGRPVIMGRGTYEAMGRLLPNRPNIIVTHQDLEVEGATVVNSLDAAYEAARKLDETIYVIGGGQIYAAAMDGIDRIYATEIDAHTDGDAHFPVIDPAKWCEIRREHHDKDDENIYDYDFVTYELRA